MSAEQLAFDLVALACPRCKGSGEVMSGEIDEDGDELPPVGCPRCECTGWALCRLDRPGYSPP